MPEVKTLYKVHRIVCTPHNKKCEISHHIDTVEGRTVMRVDTIEGYIDLEIRSSDLATVNSYASEDISFRTINYSYYHEDGECEIYKSQDKSPEAKIRVTIKCDKKRTL